MEAAPLGPRRSHQLLVGAGPPAAPKVQVSSPLVRRVDVVSMDYFTVLSIEANFTESSLFLVHHSSFTVVTS